MSTAIHQMNNSNTNNTNQGEFDLLDIFSNDMDFEQAYNIYNNLQEKNVLGSFEQLQKVQMLNQQYTTNLPQPLPQPPQPQPQQQPPQQQQFPDQFAYERAQILNNKLGATGLMNNAMNKNYSFNQNTLQQQHQQQHQLIDEDENDDDDFDQFFTNTESSALEKFLDNLANPVATGNPLQFYNHNKANSPSGFSTSNNTRFIPHDIDFNFEMHTMKVPQHLKQRSQSLSTKLKQEDQEQTNHLILKKELTEAFTHPTITSLHHHQLPSPKDTTTINQSNDYMTTKLSIPNNKFNNKKSKQLITPPTSGDEMRKRSSDDDLSDDEKRDDEDEDEEGEGEDGKPLKKRRRSSNKPLLSLEQKRLNHSHSEQKRRQLCKLAYKRCLELIIDLEAFNKLPELDEKERKSKRARINKEGLPNLSKHNALIRISNEMILIKDMNEKLKQLIDNSLS
ncbi:hypothetical protein G210_0454 [Candida maltosa Xu316]|uniref:Uncharacterized protein n=1 Tax=Candida maltosa (strain Xu316) TaxID=1245528 RepID=M3J9W8_CANMX|nr:hypothetical protein G210_0454 [Candida maltosa Xu316]